MPLKKSSYESVVKTATIRYGEDSLTVTFVPSKISVLRLKRTADANPELDANSVYILNCVTAWDYLDDKDKPLPISREVVEDMGVDLTNAIWEAITSVVNPTAPR